MDSYRRIQLDEAQHERHIFGHHREDSSAWRDSCFLLPAFTSHTLSPFSPPHTQAEEYACRQDLLDRCERLCPTLREKMRKKIPASALKPAGGNARSRKRWEEQEDSQLMEFAMEHGPPSVRKEQLYVTDLLPKLPGRSFGAIQDRW